MTNGDKIRQMSDEELSAWLTKFCVEYVKLLFEVNPHLGSFAQPKDADVESVRLSILELLQEEVQEDG